MSTEHVHTYPPGFEPDTTPLRWEPSDDILAWRFCPVCGAPLKDSGGHGAGATPLCSTCNHEFDACPCACVEDGVNVSGRTVLSHIVAQDNDSV